MAEVRATFEERLGSSAMLGHPGRIRRWLELDARDGAEPRWKVDVCCPGCGEFVFNLSQETHPLWGPEKLPSCEEIHVTHCCGWRGRLRDGVWVPSAASG